MGNRADRRASAKIARQAVKRAKTPTESAILRAAAAFAGDGLAGGLGAALAGADFDETLARLADDLHDILDDLYPAFLTEAFVAAGTGTLRIAGRDGMSAERGTRLFVCPVVGAAERIAAFAASASETAGLAASFQEFGVVSEEGGCLVAPVVLPLSAFAPRATPPGRLRALHDALSAAFAASRAGEAVDPPSPFPVLDLPRFDAAAAGLVAGALVGIELLPPGDRAGATPEEFEAEDLARVASGQSWYDSYGSDLPGLAIDMPLDWPAGAAALAWETLSLSMDAERHARGLPEGRAETLHCGPSEDGERLVVSAIRGGTAVGPFFVPAEIVWLDADEFFDRAEASTEALVEHEGEGPVIASLVAGGLR